MMENAGKCWIGWNLFVKNDQDEEKGRVTDCHVSGNRITFVTVRGQFTFYTDRGLALEHKTRFSGDGHYEAILLPPEK